MALVSMHFAFRPHLFHAFVICGAAGLIWCAAQAADIPSVVHRGHTMVAVEPLLRSLQIGYDITGTELDVDGRRYPQPLDVEGGTGYVDAHAIADFLHLRVADRAGVLVYSPDPSQAPAQPESPPLADLDAVRDRLLATLNEHRAATGGAPLVTDPIAQAAAQGQAFDMAAAAQMRHQDAQGRTPMQRYMDLGGRAHWYGENVGWYSLDVTGRSALWNVVGTLDAQMMAERPPDDGHRKNILSPDFQAVGFGICMSPTGIYLAEDFVGR